MRHLWSGVTLAILVAVSASADGTPLLGRSVHRLFLHQQFPDHVNYVLYVPAAYSHGPASDWPLILFLHGSEQRGDNPALLDEMALLTFADEARDFPFIAVIPQCPRNSHWQPGMVKSVLDSVATMLRVDKSRIYLTGFSMGGYGVWQTAAAFPGTFAALAPISGMSDLPDVPRLTGVPIWAFHGAQDENVAVTESQKMIGALRKLGSDARLTVYPDFAHDCWTITYRDSRLYLWFLDHSLADAAGGVSHEALVDR
jgi:predicted peptidase